MSLNLNLLGKTQYQTLQMYYTSTTDYVFLCKTRLFINCSAKTDVENTLKMFPNKKVTCAYQKSAKNIYKCFEPNLSFHFTFLSNFSFHIFHVKILSNKLNLKFLHESEVPVSHMQKLISRPYGRVRIKIKGQFSAFFFFFFENYIFLG